VRQRRSQRFARPAVPSQFGRSDTELVFRPVAGCISIAWNKRGRRLCSFALLFLSDWCFGWISRTTVLPNSIPPIKVSPTGPDAFVSRQSQQKRSMEHFFRSLKSECLNRLILSSLNRLFNESSSNPELVDLQI